MFERINKDVELKKGSILVTDDNRYFYVVKDMKGKLHCLSCMQSEVIVHTLEFIQNTLMASDKHINRSKNGVCICNNNKLIVTRKDKYEGV